MTVTISKSRAEGTVNAPPSKSVAHRALICAALSNGSTVHNIDYSNDIMATLECLKALRAEISQFDVGLNLGGLNVFNPPKDIKLNCRESGSTLRFLLPLCMLSKEPISLFGSERLFERPLSVYENICISQGIEIIKNNSSISVCGSLSGGEYKIPGNISSQFITGLLFALPLLKNDSIIEVTGCFESASYIDITISVLADFGIKIERPYHNIFRINGSQIYSGNIYTVEGDCSNAAFLDAFNLLGGNVQVKGINSDTLQGDKIYRDMFYAINKGEKHFDLSDCPDLAPVMFAVAAVYGGALFTGTRRLKIKESSRAECMKNELAKFGVKVSVGENDVTVSSGGIHPPNEMLCGHNDHRIVMALTLLCSITGGSISEAEAVAKSYPDFFEKISSLGIGIVKNEA